MKKEFAARALLGGESASVPIPVGARGGGLSLAEALMSSCMRRSLQSKAIWFRSLDPNFAIVCCTEVGDLESGLNHHVTSFALNS
jgi:hypothetical protein